MHCAKLSQKYCLNIKFPQMKPEMSTAAKFDYINDYIKRLAGGETLGFSNSVYLAEKEVADRNYALAYYMRENDCFPKGVNVKDCLDFWYQVRSFPENIFFKKNLVIQ